MAAWSQGPGARWVQQSQLPSKTKGFLGSRELPCDFVDLASVRVPRSAFQRHREPVTPILPEPDFSQDRDLVSSFLSAKHVQGFPFLSFFFSFSFNNTVSLAPPSKPHRRLRAKMEVRRKGSWVWLPARSCLTLPAPTACSAPRAPGYPVSGGQAHPPSRAEKPPRCSPS